MASLPFQERKVSAMRDSVFVFKWIIHTCALTDHGSGGREACLINPAPFKHVDSSLSVYRIVLAAAG